ncbi:TPA: hypothetical protein ACKP8U_001272 [Serratia marcescens]
MAKLSELSKPVGYFIEWQDEETGEKEWCECSKQNGEPLYSQEYVSALLLSIGVMGQAIDIANESTREWRARAESAEAKLERATKEQNNG